MGWPKIGSAVATLADSRTVWIIGAVAIILLSVSLLRRIWLGPPVERVLDDDGRPLYPIPASNTRAGSPFTGGITDGNDAGMLDIANPTVGRANSFVTLSSIGPRNRPQWAVRTSRTGRHQLHPESRRK